MQVTAEDLYRIIGNKEVEIDQLRRLIQRMQAQSQAQTQQEVVPQLQEKEEPKRAGKRDVK